VTCGDIRLYAFVSVGVPLFMRRPLFDYVDQIRDARKYFDVSRIAIQRELLVKGKCEVFADLDVVDDSGQVVIAQLRLNIHARDDSPLSWQVSLKLHSIRIDGIDYEGRFPTADGSTGRGWHRHKWNAAEDSAERWKVPLGDMDGIKTREEFLIRTFSLMRIDLNAVDDGQGSLFSD